MPFYSRSRTIRWLRTKNKIKDIESKIKEFRDSGVKIEKEPFKLTGGTSKIAFITDPNGIWIELIEKNKSWNLWFNWIK